MPHRPHSRFVRRRGRAFHTSHADLASAPTDVGCVKDHVTFNRHTLRASAFVRLLSRSRPCPLWPRLPSSAPMRQLLQEIQRRQEKALGVYTVRQLRRVWPFLMQLSAQRHSVHAVCCALRSAHAYWVLTGLNPMIFSIHVSRTARLTCHGRCGKKTKRSAH